jgi:hypothetical protein
MKDHAGMRTCHHHQTPITRGMLSEKSLLLPVGSLNMKMLKRRMMANWIIILSAPDLSKVEALKNNLKRTKTLELWFFSSKKNMLSLKFRKEMFYSIFYIS